MFFRCFHKQKYLLSFLQEIKDFKNSSKWQIYLVKSKPKIDNKTLSKDVSGKLKAMCNNYENRVKI